VEKGMENKVNFGKTMIQALELLASQDEVGFWVIF